MLLALPLLSDKLYRMIEAEFGAGGGAYVVKAVDEHGLPMLVPRVLGVDRSGVLYIGKADAFTDRVIYLKKCLHPRYKTEGHQVWARMEGHRGLAEAFPAERLVIDLHGAASPLQAEAQLLADYRRAFGETPPLNQIG